MEEATRASAWDVGEDTSPHAATMPPRNMRPKKLMPGWVCSQLRADVVPRRLFDVGVEHLLALTVADAVHLRGSDGQRPIDAVALDDLEHRADRAVEDRDLDDVTRRLDRRTSQPGDRDDMVLEAPQLLEQLIGALRRDRDGQRSVQVMPRSPRGLQMSAVTNRDVPAADARLNAPLRPGLIALRNRPQPKGV